MSRRVNKSRKQVTKGDIVHEIKEKSGYPVITVKNYQGPELKNDQELSLLLQIRVASREQALRRTTVITLECGHPYKITPIREDKLKNYHIGEYDFSEYRFIIRNKENRIVAGYDSWIKYPKEKNEEGREGIIKTEFTKMGEKVWYLGDLGEYPVLYLNEKFRDHGANLLMYYQTFILPKLMKEIAAEAFKECYTYPPEGQTSAWWERCCTAFKSLGMEDIETDNEEDQQEWLDKLEEVLTDKMKAASQIVEVNETGG